MRSSLLKVSALTLACALTAPVTWAQDAEVDPEAPPPPTPQEIAAENLDQLLELVKQGQARASAENKAREDRFAQDKANQAAALKRAEEERVREERRSARLEKQFEENELLIAAKQEQLRERLGTLSELFGHLTAASGRSGEVAKELRKRTETLAQLLLFCSNQQFVFLELLLEPRGAPLLTNALFFSAL